MLDMRGRVSIDEGRKLRDHRDFTGRDAHALGGVEMRLQRQDAVDAERRADAHEFHYAGSRAAPHRIDLRAALAKMGEPVGFHDLGDAFSYGKGLALLLAIAGHLRPQSGHGR